MQLSHMDCYWPLELVLCSIFGITDYETLFSGIHQ